MHELLQNLKINEKQDVTMIVLNQAKPKIEIELKFKPEKFIFAVITAVKKIIRLLL